MNAQSYCERCTARLAGIIVDVAAADECDAGWEVAGLASQD